MLQQQKRIGRCIFRRRKIHIHRTGAATQGDGCSRSHTLHLLRPGHIVGSVAAASPLTDPLQRPLPQPFVGLPFFSGDTVIAAGGIQPLALCRADKRTLGHRIHLLAPDPSQLCCHRLQNITCKGALQSADRTGQLLFQPQQNVFKIIGHKVASLSALISPYTVLTVKAAISRLPSLVKENRSTPVI